MERAASPTLLAASAMSSLTGERLKYVGTCTDPIFNMEYLDLDLVVVWLTKCVISVYLS